MDRAKRGHPTIVQPVDAAHDPETAAKLWALSERLTGVRPMLSALQAAE